MSLIYDAIRQSELPPPGDAASPVPAKAPAGSRRNPPAAGSPWPAVAVFFVIVLLGAILLGWWYYERSQAFTRPVTQLREAVKSSSSNFSTPALAATLTSPGSELASELPRAPAAAMGSVSQDAINSGAITARPNYAASGLTSASPNDSTSAGTPGGVVGQRAGVDRPSVTRPAPATERYAATDDRRQATSPARPELAATKLQRAATRTLPAAEKRAETLQPARRGPRADAAEIIEDPTTALADGSASSALARSAASADGSSSSARQEFDSFMQAMRSDDLSAAGTRLTALRQRLGANSLTLLRTESYFALAQKDLPAARRGYTRLLERLPGDVEAAINLASIELQENHVEAARAVLAEALRVKPDSEALGAAIARFKEAGR